MAIGFNLLASVGDGANASTYSTPSVTPTAGSVLVLDIAAFEATVPPGSVVPTVTGFDGTWTLLASVGSAGSNGAYRFMSDDWEPSSGPPVPGVVSVAFESGGSPLVNEGCLLRLVEVTGGASSGIDVQTVTNVGASSAVASTTMAAFGSASNAQLTFCYITSADTVITPEAGVTELGSTTTFTTPARAGHSWFKLNDTTGGATWATASVWRMISTEFAASAGNQNVQMNHLAIPVSVRTPSATGGASDNTAFALLDASGLPTDGTTFATTSVSPVAGRALILDIGAVDPLSNSQAPVVTGLGGTWNLVHAQNAGGANAAYRFVCTDYSGSGAVTATFAAVHDGAILRLAEAENVDSTAPIIQTTGAGSTTGTTASTTLAAFADPLNVALAFVYRGINETVTPEVGSTSIGSTTSHASPNRSADGWFKPDDTTPSGTFATSATWRIIASEMKHDIGGSGGGGGVVGPVMNDEPIPTPDFTYSITGRTAAQINSDLDAAHGANPGSASLRTFIRFTGNNTTLAGSIKPRSWQHIFGPCTIDAPGTTLNIFDLKNPVTAGVKLSDMTISGGDTAVITWDRCFLLRLKMHDCFQRGFGCNGDNVANLGMVVDSCEVWSCGDASIVGWSAGGSKYSNLGNPVGEADSIPPDSSSRATVSGSTLVVRNTIARHNDGVGLWNDLACAGVLLENNLCYQNLRHGIRFEICAGPALIRRNICYQNGWNAATSAATGTGCGIIMTGSAYCDTIENELWGNADNEIDAGENWRSDIPGGPAFFDAENVGTLTSSVNATQTTIPANQVLSPGTGFNSHIHIDNESMRVNSISGSGASTTYGVTRGVSSTAASHSTGRPITLEPGVIYPDRASHGHGMAIEVNNILNNWTLNASGNRVQIATGEVRRNIDNTGHGGVINYDPTVPSIGGDQNVQMTTLSVPITVRTPTVNLANPPAQTTQMQTVSVPVTVNAPAVTVQSVLNVTMQKLDIPVTVNPPLINRETVATTSTKVRPKRRVPPA